MAAFGEIERATRDDPRYGHPSGVNAYITLVYHGPKIMRQQLRDLGLRIFGTGEHEEGNFTGLDRMFAGLSVNDTPARIHAVITSRLEEARGPRTAPQPPPITIQSLGPGTPAMPVVPKPSVPMPAPVPLGPYRKSKP